MANPSQKGARGPAGPVAEPPKTGTVAPPAAAPPAAAPDVAASSGFDAARPSSAIPAGSSLVSGLKETAQTTADAVRQQAAHFAVDVGHEFAKTGEAQKARGVEAIRGVARAIDSAAAELEKQSPSIARTVHEAARRVDGLSDNLSNRNVNEIVDSAARLARAQPALFIGGSVAAGFALARFLRSSAGQRQSVGYDPYQR
jgi:hypothetical protein